MTLAALLKEDEDEIIAIQDELYSLGEFFSKQGSFQGIHKRNSFFRK